MNKMTLNDFSSAILNNIFLKLPLEQIQECSKTCKKFNLIISDDFFWKNLEAQEIKKANFNVLKKYGSKLSAQQIAYFNFKQKPKEMIEARFFDKNDKKNFFIRLGYALSRLRRGFIYSKEYNLKYGQQIHHAHLMFWDNKDEAKLKIFKNPEKKEEWEKKLKEMENEDKSLLEAACNSPLNPFPNIIKIIYRNNLKLQIESSEELTNFYSVLWKEYSPKDLDPLSDDRFSYMPIELFKGFCHFIKTMDGNFGSFQGWYLSEEHLEAWNRAFENRKVEKIYITLLDIKKETLLKFIEIIKNTELKPCVKVECRYEAIDFEIHKIFTNVKSENIKKWKISYQVCSLIIGESS